MLSVRWLNVFIEIRYLFEIAITLPLCTIVQSHVLVHEYNLCIWSKTIQNIFFPGQYMNVLK